MIKRYTRPEMELIWDEKERFKLLLEVELLAMEAMAKYDIIPKNAAKVAREKASFSVERIHELDKKLKHDVIAFLTSVSETIGEEGRYLHFGMTSSDLIDTAFSVQLVKASDLIIDGLDKLLGALKKRAEEHKLTICMGRTHGVHAEPTTFGLKLAGFYAEIKRARERIEAGREGIRVGAISGPVGTYSQLPPQIEAYVCEKLDLKPAAVSTQVLPRDLHAGLFQTFACLASSIERIVLEVRHLQRTEVREAEEFFAKGQKGSSAMPHKRNPVLSENVTGLCRVIKSMAGASLDNVALWHERDISHSSSERVIAPDITLALDFIIHRVAGLISDLLVYPERMKKNIASSGNLYFSSTLLVALSAKGISREDAYDIAQKNAMRVWESIDGDSPLDFKTEVLKDSDVLKLMTQDELNEVFSNDRYFKYVDEIFKRAFDS